MKKNGFLLLLCIFVFVLGMSDGESQMSPKKHFIGEQTQNKVVHSLLEKYGEENRYRIEKGVKQAASFWNEKDGEAEVFEEFCNKHFAGTPENLELLFSRLSEKLEAMNGHFNRMVQEFKKVLDLDMGEILPMDVLFGEFDPAAHVTEDLFKTKIAFVVLLNFPSYTLEEKKHLAGKWSRKDWAYARMGDMFLSRVPAEVYQKLSQAMASADLYISEYNICMGNLVNAKHETFFPKNLKLISHWGLRDELKAHYNKPGGTEKQQMIYQVMKRIISQEIPQAVINNDAYRWDPYENKVYQDKKEIECKSEPDTRYRYFLGNFQAIREVDPYYPTLPTPMKREFEMGREMSEQEVEALFDEFLRSPQLKKAAQLIAKRLGRPLLPFDIWYDGFKARSNINLEEMDQVLTQKYPNTAAFESDLRNILFKLGFSPVKADFIASKIAVDPARGAGHAWGAQMKSEKARLRTRIPKTGMDYKGFNIAMHEFGHNVEQTLTLNKVDYYMLQGVPNTAFTEAFAFVFQERDMEMLGIDTSDPNRKHLQALDLLWSTHEIMGVSLVDMKVWNWMYEHPKASAEEVKKAIITIATEVWNQYYAENFGVKDSPILGIYSHMIAYPLYLPNYPLGHLIQFQIEKYLENKNLGTEMERMCVQGRIIPQAWMKQAVGSEISTKPLLEAAEEALSKIE